MRRIFVCYDEAGQQPEMIEPVTLSPLFGTDTPWMRDLVETYGRFRGRAPRPRPAAAGQPAETR
ncbi:hypothetical protein NRB56_03800 [Nocardia sp. RB56]|uniref:Uncharacterized protein n=1 Tax=Nocardia aurantia TaxID=2585199 RepID=A0A7K0DGQ7_9NOCA|nr:hypothetical protein [Nocardia aurantia]